MKTAFHQRLPRQPCRTHRGEVNFCPGLRTLCSGRTGSKKVLYHHAVWGSSLMGCGSKIAMANLTRHPCASWMEIKDKLFLMHSEDHIKWTIKKSSKHKTGSDWQTGVLIRSPFLWLFTSHENPGCCSHRGHVMRLLEWGITFWVAIHIFPNPLSLQVLSIASHIYHSPSIQLP
jgi:hypothetical protein